MLQAIQLLFLVTAVAVVVKIVMLQFFYRPSEKETAYYGTPEKVDTLYPVRGAIYDAKDRLIALSVPMYNISMDCTVRKQEFRNDRVSESEWCSKAYALSEGLARIVGGDTREWYSRIMTKRQKNQPYLKIADLVDYDTMKQLIELPLFNEGKFKGGIQIETVDTRKYPYGSLGRRAIGVVANNRQKTRITGLEEKCNRELHGEEGYAKMTYTDRKGTYVPVSGWKSKKARNGLDVKSTLDMDIQDLADRSLRELMAGNPHITHGCFLIMDVESGAIRAMVNLKKASDGNMGEVYNYAVTTANNPGSVFKVATLMAALDEGLISLSDSIPCMDGRYVYKNIKCPLDKHATKDHYPSGYIGVEEGLKISSNHVFRYIGGECFGKSNREIRKYLSLLESYNLFSDFDFDINGLAKCSVKDPCSSGEALTLPMVAMGYDMATTPVHLLCFYNAIANGGRQMKPYMIDSYMREGETVRKFEPQVLNPSICKKSTADSLTRALLKVTGEMGGTGYWAFRGAKCPVAGKTGTAFIAYKSERTGKTTFSDDRMSHYIQGSFAGFFPADNPKYSAICVIYTDLTSDNIEGSRCARAVRAVADALWSMNPEWNEGIRDKGRLPKAPQIRLVSGKESAGRVPDVKGLGLSDAIYSLESCGYSCSYEGHGTVVSQDPAPNSARSRGSKVHLRLK